MDFTYGRDEEDRTTLVVPGRETDFIGKLAYSSGVPLNELTLKRASLEDAFMEMTGDDVQYQAQHMEGGAK